MQQNPTVSKAFLKSVLNHANYCIPRRHRLLAQTTKQPLSNFEPQKQ